MADKSVSVQITGIAELQRAFGWVDKELNHEMRSAFLGIASQVVGSARVKIPRKTGTAADSLVARSSERGASLAFGGQAAPYLPWLNFGGSVGRHKSIRRAFVKPDRYIFATIKEQHEPIIAAVDQVIKKVASEASFETTGGI